MTQIDHFEHDPRLKEVTEVINCAALASFSNNPLIWPTNVDGTLAFASLMSRVAPLRRFVHVGTAMSCGIDAPLPVAEDFHLRRAMRNHQRRDEHFRANEGGFQVIPQGLAPSPGGGCRGAYSPAW